MLFYVRVAETDEIVAICSRRSDAEAFVNGGGIDKKQYKIEIVRGK